MAAQPPEQGNPPLAAPIIPGASGEPESSPGRDPGSRSAGIIAWAVVAVLLPVVIVIQQFEANPGGPTGAEQTAEIAAPTALDPFNSSAKPLLKLFHARLIDPDGGALTDLLVQALSDAATTDPDRLRLAIAQWEIGLDDAAQRTLDDLGESLEPGSSLATDVETFSRILAGDGAPEGEAREGFIERHGWYAQIALAHDDPDRHDELLAGGGPLAVILLVLGVGVVLLLIVGCVLLIIGLVLMNTGRMPRRFEPPRRGGSVYLEMLPVFIAGFLGLQTLSAMVGLVFGEVPGIYAALALQWLLLGVIGWPVIRGVPWARVRRDLGLFAPRGMLREMGAGVLFYVAAMPVYFLIAAVVVAIYFVIEVVGEAMRGGMGGQTPPQPPSNPIVDLIGGGDPVMLVMLALLAMIWAPLMEEAVFRGGVYRHLRSRMGWVVAALLVAFFFGMMHQYHPLQLIPVMALGFIFAMMREWRGSIIPAMTAHFLHNLTVFTLLAVLLSVAMG